MEPLQGDTPVQWTVLLFLCVFVLHLLLVCGFCVMERGSGKDAGHYWRLEEKET